MYVYFLIYCYYTVCSLNIAFLFPSPKIHGNLLPLSRQNSVAIGYGEKKIVNQ